MNMNLKDEESRIPPHAPADQETNGTLFCGGAACKNASLELHMSKKTPWPESASELYKATAAGRRSYLNLKYIFQGKIIYLRGSDNSVQ
jgi:hypothetical protein